MTSKIIENKMLIGRNEWCGLPDLKIPIIKAKVDTGAKTSALHAFNITCVPKGNHEWAHFNIHPMQSNIDLTLQCKAKIIDKRFITSSNGHKELRYVIATMLRLGKEQWPIELTLSNRDPLRYRMLLGREALSDKVLIDPHLSCHQKKFSRQRVEKLYANFEKN